MYTHYSPRSQTYFVVVIFYFIQKYLIFNKIIFILKTQIRYLVKNIILTTSYLNDEEICNSHYHLRHLLFSTFVFYSPGQQKWDPWFTWSIKLWRVTDLKNKRAREILLYNKTLSLSSLELLCMLQLFRVDSWSRQVTIELFGLMIQVWYSWAF